MAEQPPQTAFEPPQCPGCGYNLTGLARQGECPECGRHYDVDVWAKFVKRPLFGVGHVLLPLSTMLLLWIVLAELLGLIVCALYPLMGMVYIAWSGVSAERVAEWQYSRAVAEDLHEQAVQDAPEWIKNQRRRLVLLQMAGLALGMCLLAIVYGLVGSAGCQGSSWS